MIGHAPKIKMMKEHGRHLRLDDEANGGSRGTWDDLVDRRWFHSWVGGWQDHEKGGGYGVIADILLGIVSEIVGGWVVGLLGFGSGGMI